jgi:hypothetical protein
MIVDAKWSNLRPSILPTGTRGIWQRINTVDVEVPNLNATVTIRLPTDIKDEGSITAFLESSPDLKDEMINAVRKQPVTFSVTIEDKELTGEVM